MFEYVVDVFSITLIVSIVLCISYGPTIHSVNARLWPPTIEDGAVWDTIHGCFHAGCSRRFHGTNWIVEPYVNTTCHHQSGVHIVIFDESNRNFVSDLFGRIEDISNQLFSSLISWMCFSREDKLNFSSTNLAQTLQILEHKICSLVGCKPTSKSNCQTMC